MLTQGQLAAWYATEHGYAVFPCLPVTMGKLKAKIPLITNGCSDATIDLATIRQWWKHWPEAAVGINTGKSGLVVIDCDIPKAGKVLTGRFTEMPGVIDGEDVLAVLAEEAGQPFPWSRSVRTPSGGVHYYFSLPLSLAIPPSQPIGPMTRFGKTPGSSENTLVDVRAGNSYVIAAGSWIDARQYTMLDKQPIQPLPEWLAKLARKEPKSSSSSSSPNTFRPDPLGMTDYPGLEGVLQKVLDTPEGNRNGILFWAAGRILDNGAYGYSLEKVKEALVWVGRQVGLDDHEIGQATRYLNQAGVS